MSAFHTVVDARHLQEYYCFRIRAPTWEPIIPASDKYDWLTASENVSSSLDLRWHHLQLVLATAASARVLEKHMKRMKGGGEKHSE